MANYGRKPQRMDVNPAAPGGDYGRKPQQMGAPAAPNTGSGGLAMAGQGGWEMKTRNNQQPMAQAPTQTGAPAQTGALKQPTAQATQPKPVSNPYSLTNPMGTLEAAGAALAEHEANQPKPYQSKYGTQIQSLLDNLLNRESFRYDAAADPLYQQYAEQYNRGGQMAMKNAMAQSAALTGGYGNSYAQQVGQQAYQGYMQELSGMIPQLQQAAYDMYRDEGDTMRSNLGMLQGMDDTDYGRYRDDVGDYWTMMDYLYGKYGDWYPRAAEQYAMQQAGAAGGGGGYGGNGSGESGGTIDPLAAILAGIGTAGSGVPEQEPYRRRPGQGANLQNNGTR